MQFQSVVVKPLNIDGFAGVGETSEEMRGWTFIAQFSIETIVIAILLFRRGLDVERLDVQLSEVV